MGRHISVHTHITGTPGASHTLPQVPHTHSLHTQAHGRRFLPLISTKSLRIFTLGSNICLGGLNAAFLSGWIGALTLPQCNLIPLRVSVRCCQKKKSGFIYVLLLLLFLPVLCYCTLIDLTLISLGAFKTSTLLFWSCHDLVDV